MPHLAITQRQERHLDRIKVRALILYEAYTFTIFWMSAIQIFRISCRFSLLAAFSEWREYLRYHHDKISLSGVHFLLIGWFSFARGRTTWKRRRQAKEFPSRSANFVSALQVTICHSFTKKIIRPLNWGTQYFLVLSRIIIFPILLCH